MHRHHMIVKGILLGVIALGFGVGCHPVAAYPASVATPHIITVRMSTTSATATASSTPVLTTANIVAYEQVVGVPTGTPVPTETPTPTGNAATSVQIGTGPFAFSVDLGDWIAKLFAGLWKALGVDGIKAFGDNIAGWLLVTPNLAATGGQMGNVQHMVDALQLAALSLVVVLFIAAVYRIWLGGEASPVATLGRLGAVLFALGFYRSLAGLLVDASNAVSGGVLHAGVNTAPTGFGAFLEAIPGTSPLWSLAGVVALALLFALGIVRMLGFAFLLVAYVLGPVMLPLGLLPETAGYCALWGKHSAKLLFWPALWAVEFRLFDALREGLYLPQGSLGQTILAPFAALGMLLVMFRTPLMLHSASFEGYVRTATRVVRTAVVTAASGGAGTFFTGGTTGGAAAMGTVGTRRATTGVSASLAHASPSSSPTSITAPLGRINESERQ